MSENTLMSVERDEDRQKVANAVAEADQLLATFNALLRIARLEVSNKASNFQKFNLSELVQDAGELYEALAEDKEQHFHHEIQENIQMIGDRDLIFQTLCTRGSFESSC